MSTKTIGQLPSTAILPADALVEVEVNGLSQRVQISALQGAVLAGYIPSKVPAAIEDAIQSATEAVQQVQEALGSAKAAADSAANSEVARQAAVAARGVTEVHERQTRDARDAAAANADAAAVSAGNADASARTASGKAEIATQKATEAGEAATLVKASIDTATTKAGEASASASRALTSERNAAEAVVHASDSEELAARSALAAGNASSAAVSAAQSAETKAGEAGQSATAARQERISAETAKGDAQASAKSASDSAAVATDKASAAQKSAELAATYAQGGSNDQVARAAIGDVKKAYAEADKALGESLATVSARTATGFTIVARGANAILPTGALDAGIYNAAGGEMLSRSRGYVVAIWGDNNTITASKRFDTYGGLSDGGSADMANYLNSLPNGTTATFHTFDEPANNRLLPALVTAMERFGAGAAFSSPDFQYRGAYVLIGRAGIGRGMGREIYAGRTVTASGATDAYIVEPFALLRGVPQTTGVGSVLQAVASDLTRAFVAGDQVLGSRTTLLESTAARTAGLINSNPSFATWPDSQSLPTRWQQWNNSATERRSRSDGLDGYAARVTSGTGQAGGLWDTPLPLFPGWYILDAEVELVSGSYVGSGVTIQGYTGIHFATDADNNGDVSATRTGRRRYTRLVNLPATCTNWHAMNGWAGWVAPADIAAKTIDWYYCGIRPASDADIKAGKADAALNAPGGVLARVKSTEDTIADLPNRYAAASRTAVLESQVNFATDSGLLRTVNARIEDRATSIADAKAGAVAQTVNELRTQYNGTASTVSTQQGSISDLYNRNRAWWAVTADNGSGRVQLAIYAEGSNSGVDITGNVRIFGNLLVAGTVTSQEIANGAVTNSVASNGADTNSGSGEVKVLAEATLNAYGSGYVRIDVQSTILIYNGGSGPLLLYLIREKDGNTTNIGRAMQATVSDGYARAYWFLDNPGPGIVTYRWMLSTNSIVSPRRVATEQNKISVSEVKK